MSAHVVLVYELHHQSPGVEKAVHEALRKHTEFLWSGLPSTWEIMTGEGGMPAAAFLRDAERKFRDLVAKAGGTNATFKIWAAPRLESEKLELVTSGRQLSDGRE
jgi:hypothetical protein